MTDDEPDAMHYFRKAAEDMEDDARITLYYIARGLLQLAESLASQTTKETVTGGHRHTRAHLRRLESDTEEKRKRMTRRVSFARLRERYRVSK
jgi:hypothetical protein